MTAAANFQAVAAKFLPTGRAVQFSTVGAERRAGCGLHSVRAALCTRERWRLSEQRRCECKWNAPFATPSWSLRCCPSTPAELCASRAPTARLPSMLRRTCPPLLPTKYSTLSKRPDFNWQMVWPAECMGRLRKTVGQVSRSTNSFSRIQTCSSTMCSNKSSSSSINCRRRHSSRSKKMVQGRTLQKRCSTSCSARIQRYALAFFPE